MGEIYSRPYRTQEELIDSLKERHIGSDRIEDAFRRVDRAQFMPEAERSHAYSDTAWRHEELHLSAPSIYATVLSHLNPQPGQSFLNLGSGTGYFSTIVGLLIGPQGINHGVEVKPVVMEHAQTKVKEFRETAPEDYYTAFSVPEFFGGNFFSICPSSRRYDLIYCGAGISNKEDLFSLRNLLNVNGRFIVPYRNSLISITLTPDNKFVTNNLMSVAFSQAIAPTTVNPDSSIVLPSPKPDSLLRLASVIIRRLIALRMIEERGRPGMRIVAYSRNLDPSSPTRRLPHPLDSDEESLSLSLVRGPRFQPLAMSDVDTEEDDEDEDAHDDDTDDDDDADDDSADDNDDNEDGPHGPGGGGGERNALGPDMHRLYLFLRSLHTQDVAFSLTSSGERINAQIPHEAEGEEEEEGEGRKPEAEVSAAEKDVSEEEKVLAAEKEVSAIPLRSCKRGLDSGESSDASSVSGGGGAVAGPSGDHRERVAENGEAAKKSRRSEGPISAWPGRPDSPVEMDIELDDGSVSLRLSNEEARGLENVQQTLFGVSACQASPKPGQSSPSSSERSAGRENRERHSSTSSGSTEGPDDRVPLDITPVFTEVLSEPRYDVQVEIRSRFEKLPLPVPLKQYLMLSR